MASKKKSFASGEMRPLSALAKGSGSDSKKKSAPMRVPEPPKYPQYNFINVQNDPKDILDPLREGGAGEVAAEFQQMKPLGSLSAAAPRKEQPAQTESERKKPMEEIVIDIPLSPAAAEPAYAEPVRNAAPKKPAEPVKPAEAAPVQKPAEPAEKPETMRTPVQEEKPDVQPAPHKVKPRPIRQAEYETIREVKAAPRKRGEKAPDLTDKAARDAFFLKYGSVPVRKNPSYSPELEAAMSQPEPAEEQSRRVNPFFRYGGKTVISHLKEEPAEEPETVEAPEDISAEEPYTEEAPKEMLDIIEETMRQQREEREEAQRDPEAEAMEKARSMSHKVRTIGLMGLIAVCGLFLLLGERSTFSSEENRKLAEKPELSLQSYLNGEFTSGLSAYYNDTVPMRSTFKRAIASMENWKGVHGDDEENIEFFGDVAVREQAEVQTEAATDAPLVTTMADMSAVAGSLVSTDVTTATEVTTTTEPEEYEPPVEVGGSIIIHKKRAINFYGGLPSIAEEYADVLKDFKLALPRVKVYSLIAPTAVSFYLPEEYEDYTASEKDNIDYVAELFEGNGVTPVDAYSVLEAHKDEAIYARTDHHWLPLGAYYAAEEFAKTAGVPFNDISDMDSETRDDYVGSMYTYTSSTILSENPEEFTYYMPRNEYTTEYYNEYFGFDYEGDLFMDMTYYSPVNYYLVFMGGDDKIVHISTDVDNDRTLVIFKDSYGNAMVPCLVGSFEEIYVCDIRYFYLNAADFCKDVGCTDLLFAMNSFSATGGNQNRIEEILYYY